MLTTFRVGEIFPGPVPIVEGITLELWGGGLTCLIQFPQLARPERQMFKKSFQWYGYLESSTPVPIAIWIFDFPKPFGRIDCSFNARVVDQARIDDYMEPENGQVKNAITFYLLDGPILKGMKIVGLKPDAVKLFHATVRKQLETEYTQDDFDLYLAAMYSYSTDDLFQMSTTFKKK